MHFVCVCVRIHAYVHVSICARVCVLRPRVWLEIAISAGRGRVEAILDLTCAEVGFGMTLVSVHGLSVLRGANTDNGSMIILHR